MEDHCPLKKRVMAVGEPAGKIFRGVPTTLILPNPYHPCMVNVGKYTIHGSSGKEFENITGDQPNFQPHEKRGKKTPDFGHGRWIWRRFHLLGEDFMFSAQKTRNSEAAKAAFANPQAHI